MNKARYFPFLVVMVLLVSSCSLKRLYMVDQPVKTAPSEGKVLVNFVRPSSFGYSAKATVWDGDKLIGVSFGKQSFQYECEPGKHLFVAWSEYKSPVEAELEANKVYFIALRIRMGWWRGRIHQVPVNKSNPLWDEVVTALRTNPNRGFLASALTEAEAEGKPKIREYLSRYDKEVKGTDHVSYLNRQDGVSPGDL